MAHFDYYLTADSKQAILDDLRAGFPVVRHRRYGK